MKPYFYGNSNGLSMKAGPIWKRSHLNLRSKAEKHSPKVRRMPPKWQWQPWSPVEKLILQSSVLLEVAKVVQTNYENLRVAMQNFGKSKNGSACSPSVILVCAHLEDDGNSHKAFDLSCAKICLYSQKSIQSFHFVVQFWIHQTKLFFCCMCWIHFFEAKGIGRGSCNWWRWINKVTDRWRNCSHYYNDYQYLITNESRCLMEINHWGLDGNSSSSEVL